MTQASLSAGGSGGHRLTYKLTASDKDVLLRLSGHTSAGDVDDEHVTWQSVCDISAFLDHFQTTLDKWRNDLPETDALLCRGSRLLIKLSEHTRCIPALLFITCIRLDNPNAVSGGGYADIFYALHGANRVALKRLRIFPTDPWYGTTLVKFTREVLIWRQLEHPNLLPFLGVNMTIFDGNLCMVSPWMARGNVLKYLADRSVTPDLIEQLSLEIIDGLAYLHGRSIAHGDLRGANILIDEMEHVRLADFGLSKIVSETATLSTTATRGATRWMAPEALDPQISEKARSFGSIRTAADVYSFGCVLLELHTLRVPFHYIPSDTTVALQILKGNHPNRPSPTDCIPGLPCLPDATWILMEKCWTYDATKRIQTANLKASLCVCDDYEGWLWFKKKLNSLERALRGIIWKIIATARNKIRWYY